MEMTLHDESELFELFLDALQGAATKLQPGGSFARCVVRDAVAAAGEEAADEVGGLPGVEAGLQEIFAKAGEVGFGKFFNRKLLWFCRHCLSRPAVVAEGHWVYVIRRCCPTLVVGRIVAFSSTSRVESVCIFYAGSGEESSVHLVRHVSEETTECGSATVKREL